MRKVAISCIIFLFFTGCAHNNINVEMLPNEVNSFFYNEVGLSRLLIRPPKKNNKAWQRGDFFLIDRNKDNRIDQIILFGYKKNDSYEVIEELLDRDFDGSFETKYVHDSKTNTSKFKGLKKNIRSDLKTK